LLVIGLHLGEQLLVRENAGFGVGVSLELDSEAIGRPSASWW
jgi:hypothetical protein